MEELSVEQLLVNAISVGDIDGVRARVGICDINAKVNGKPILQYAVSQSIEMLTLILDQPGVNIDATNNEGFSALHFSILEQDPVKLSLLLARGAKADLLSFNDSSALMLAAQVGSAEKVRMLLAHDVNVTRRNKLGQGYIALGYAIARIQRNNEDLDVIEIVKLLLAQGAAFCLDEPRLKTLIPFMDHFSGCYFFDTKMGNETITRKTEGFELATVFEFGPPEIKINFAEIPISILLSRCAELLSKNPNLLRLRQLQRCLLFNMTADRENDLGQVFRRPVLGLRELCLEQIVRQPNIKLEEVVVDLHEPIRKFKELELCDERIAELEKLIARSNIRKFLRESFPPGIGGVVCFLVAVFGLLYVIPPLKRNKVLIFAIIGVVLGAAILGFASTGLLNQINFRELTKLKEFLQRVANEDVGGRGLSVVMEVEGSVDSIEYFERYRCQLIEYRQQLSNNVMRTVKHHHFFQRVFEAKKEPAKNNDVAIELYAYQKLPANDNNAVGATYSPTQNPRDVNAHRATK